MQSQVRLKIYPEGSFIKDPTIKKGSWGDPVLYRHDEVVNRLPSHWSRKGYPIGTILVGTKPENGVTYYYEIKEYKDGWWKLEWPD